MGWHGAFPFLPEEKHMAHRTQVRFAWDTTFNIDTDKLPQLIKLLEDATPVSTGYINDERVHYVCEEDVIRSYGPAPKAFYITEAEYRAQLEERRRQEEEDAAA
jgi:hypothetical protein